MTAPAHAPVVAFLRRAGLFAAVLAVMAGIFGMHVLTTTHALHSPEGAAASVDIRHGSSPAVRMEDHALRPSAAPDIAGAGNGMRTVQCPDSGNCTSMQAMTAACTPSAKTGSLTAPLPGTGIIARNTEPGGPATTNARWSYRPGSPSPGELCISRT